MIHLMPDKPIDDVDTRLADIENRLADIRLKWLLEYERAVSRLGAFATPGFRDFYKAEVERAEAMERLELLKSIANAYGQREA